MRKSFNGHFVLEGDKLIGLYFGYDHCSEHEWGIKGLRYKFGLKDADVGTTDLWGVESRRCRIVPEDLVLFPFAPSAEEEGAPETWVLALDYDLGRKTRFQASKELYSLDLDYNYVPDVRKDGTPCKARRKKVYKDFACAWGEHSFGVRSTRKDLLEEIVAAAKSNDLLMQLGGPDAGNPFGGSGLTFGIISRMPQVYLDAMYASDKEHWELEAYVRQTGIREELKAAGRGFYALFPRRWSDGIKFYLNPMEQQVYHWGWYTLEELRMWAQGKGPVIDNAIAYQAEQAAQKESEGR